MEPLIPISVLFLLLYLCVVTVRLPKFIKDSDSLFSVCVSDTEQCLSHS